MEAIRKSVYCGHRYLKGEERDDADSTPFFLFTALQFIVITSHNVSLRLAKKKQQRTLNTTQLRIFG